MIIFLFCPQQVREVIMSTVALTKRMPDSFIITSMSRTPESLNCACSPMKDLTESLKNEPASTSSRQSSNILLSRALQNALPDDSTAVVLCYVQAIHDRRAAGQLAGSFDIRIVLAPLNSNARVKRNCHGSPDRKGQYR